MYKEIINMGFVPCEGNQYRPKFLGSDFLFYLVIFLLVLKLFSIPFLLYFPQTSLFADITRNALINLVNQERVSLGIEPLEESMKLEQAAYLKARDMMEKDYFSHQSPEGVSPWYWFERVGYSYKFAGENLAIGFLESGEVHQAWLGSFSHKENLLNPKYKEIGIGIVKGDFQGNETTVVVQLFGAPQQYKQQEEVSGQEQVLAEPQEEEVSIQQEEETTLPVKAGGVEGEEKAKAGFTFGLIRFFYSDYDNLITYFVLILIIISLIILVLVKYDISQRDLVLRAVIFIILLSLSIIFDKEAIIQLIPHNLIIY